MADSKLKDALELIRAVTNQVQDPPVQSPPKEDRRLEKLSKILEIEWEDIKDYHNEIFANMKKMQGLGITILISLEVNFSTQSSPELVKKFLNKVIETKDKEFVYDI